MRTGRVYKIIHTQSNIIYISSTFQELRYRFREHKNAFKEYLKGKRGFICLYLFFEKYGIEKFRIIPIAEYQVIDKKHLMVYEQLWINKLNSINKNNSFQLLRG